MDYVYVKSPYKTHICPYIYQGQFEAHINDNGKCFSSAVLVCVCFFFSITVGGNALVKG